MPPDPAVTSDAAERAWSPAAGIDDYAAVRLLARRARAVSPGFELTPVNAPAVANSHRLRHVTIGSV